MQLMRLLRRPKNHNIHLIEKPTHLYSCEKARLYLGFSTNIQKREDKLVLEVCPQSFIRESVYDYLRWRRGRGASAKSIEKHALLKRSNVVLAPSGYYGRLVDLVYVKAEEQQVSKYDQRSLPEFWKDVYSIDVDEDEMPLLKVRLMKLDATFTILLAACSSMKTTST